MEKLYHHIQYKVKLTYLDIDNISIIAQTQNAKQPLNRCLLLAIATHCQKNTLKGKKLSPPNLYIFGWSTQH